MTTIELRQKNAFAYAAAVKQRKIERECHCLRCQQAKEEEKLQAVLNILESLS